MLRRLVKVGPDGQEVKVYGEPDYVRILDVDRAGRRALLVRPGSAGQDLWVTDLERDRTTRATHTRSQDIDGTFSPDGVEIAVSALGVQGRALWAQSTSGSSAERVLSESPKLTVGQWSSDGKHLIGAVQRTDTRFNIAYLALDDPGTVRTFAVTPFMELGPQLSPDGRWITWQSDESGQFEVYLSDFPDARRKWQLSKDGAFPSPALWAPTGDAVYYRRAEDIIRIPVSIAGEDLQVGASEVVLEAVPSDYLRWFLVPDGHFLFMKAVGEEAAEPVRIIRNWQRILEDDE